VVEEKGAAVTFFAKKSTFNSRARAPRDDDVLKSPPLAVMSVVRFSARDAMFESAFLPAKKGD